MPELLFELFSEEIPARMQRQAAADLQKLVTGALVEAGVTYESAKAFATPRRLALTIHGLPAQQPDTREEKKGPRVGAPEAAVQGFLKSAGLASLDEAKIESDPKKGEFYVAVIEKKGRPTLELLAEILPAVIRAFPWPKSMRWGAQSREPGSLRWVRPLRAIVATFGAEGDEPEVVPFEIDGIKSGNITYGHRFLSPEAIKVSHFADYVSKLEAAKVVLDTDRRKEIIKADAATAAFAQGLEVVEDEGLLEEVAGLVEWPVVLMGAFEEEFLDVPGEVIRATIRANQKCFVVRRGDGSLANRFLLTSNIEATDGGKVIVNGNERVIRARLSDAKFFWDTDRKVWANDPEFKRLEKFKSVTFHEKLGRGKSTAVEKLGSQWERIERIRVLARELCTITGADEAQVDLAARICKADLQTEVVGEFPEVQGLMGRKYATILGLPASVAAACEEHYKPIGPTDTVPTDKVSVTVALADKLDTLVGFWAIDEKPTGSKDPYALRRAALGVIRLIVENDIKVSLLDFVSRPVGRIFNYLEFLDFLDKKSILDGLRESPFRPIFELPTTKELADAYVQYLHSNADNAAKAGQTLLSDLLSFFHDRLKVMLRDQGARHDLVDAVLGNGEANDDLLLVVRRVEALGKFLDTEDGKSLLAGYKRAANILRAEEKKDGEGAFDIQPAIKGAVEDKVKHVDFSLSLALNEVEARVVASLEQQDFEAAMRAMATLRVPIDAFFEAVMVNAEDASVRLNRLALLAQLRRVTRQVADFSKIAG